MSTMIEGSDAATEYYMDGFHDDEIGSVDTCVHAISVWFAPEDAERVGHGYAIQTTDSQGFVSTALYDSFTEWDEAWRLMTDAHLGCCTEEDEA